MSVRDSELYLSDVCAELQNINIDYFRNSSILITGATGLIGSSLVDLLLESNKRLGANISIYVAGRNKEKSIVRFSNGAQEGLKFVYYDATKPIEFAERVDYIIHCASNASPDKYLSEPVDTMLANVVGIHNLLEYAVQNNAKKILYVSSSEVYGELEHGMPMLEKEYGGLDILSVRSSYSMSKRAAETMCICYAKQYSIPVLIVRPGHIYGPTARSFDKRISSDFAYKAARGENLVMKSEGLQLRSYCYCLDCATAILKVLEKGENSQAYNISNRNSIITIRQMAEIVAKSAGVELILELPTEYEKSVFNPMKNSSLNSEKLEELGWKAIFDANVGLSNTIKILKDL